MSWRDSLQKASFRGAPFFVSSPTVDGGRRQVVHEYAMRDTPYVEDMGRKHRGFDVQGYVLGKDYLSARDALEKALDEAGPGLLVLPTRGQVSVCVLAWRSQETADKGGAAFFTISCVESGEQDNPAAVPHTTAKVGSAADKMRGVSGSLFEKGWSVAGKYSRVLAKGVQSVRKAAARGSSLAYSSTTPGSLAASLAALAGVSESTLPGFDLASALSGMFTDGTDLYGAIDSRLHRQRTADMLAFRSNWRPSAASSGPSTGSAAQSAANDEALASHMRLSSLAEACRSASLADLSTSSEVLATRDTLMDAMDEELDYTDDDDVHAAVADMRTAVVADMAEKAAAAPQSVTYSPRIALPSLSIAQALYRDADRAEEIEQRNAVRHPGFCRGPLEVLRA